MCRGLRVLVSLALAGTGALDVAAQDRMDLYLGGSLLHLDFREYADTGQQLVRELGFVPGVVAGAARNSGRWEWSAELSHHSGAVDYDGQTQAGASFATTTDITMGRMRARALYRLDEQGRFAVGLGAGYRQWLRQIRGRGNVAGLDERFTSGDVSVDARLSALRSAASTVDVDVQLAWPIRPQVKVDSGRLYGTQTLMLGPRLATRVSLPAALTIGPRSRLVVEPGFTAWSFGRSDSETLHRDGVPAGVVYQPQGKGYDFDLKLLWVQSF
jgi:hypothetical protein